MASHITLNELNLPFTLELVDTESSTTSNGKDYRTINPNGYVPALQLDNGKVITENMAILQYLANLQPAQQLTPLYGSFEYTQLQEILSYLSTELHKAYSPFFSSETLDYDTAKQAKEKICKRIDTIETRLQDGRLFLMGDNYTVADSYAFVILNWSNFIDLSLDRWPHTTALLQRVINRPATIKAMTREGLIEAEAH